MPARKRQKGGREAGGRKAGGKGGQQIACAYDRLAKVEDLKPYPRNNQTHSQRQIELLAKAIKEHGWRAPITVSNQSGYVVRGHARLEAAKVLGLAKVPVDFQDYACASAERADRIADNKLPQLAEWDEDALKAELRDLATGEMDMEFTGFSAQEIEDLMTADGGSSGGDPASGGGGGLVTCPECGYEFET